MPYANNKGKHQPVHLRSLISTFVVRCIDRIIPLVSVIPEPIHAISKVSRLLLASKAEQVGLSLTWSQTPEDTFSRDMAQL